MKLMTTVIAGLMVVLVPLSVVQAQQGQGGGGPGRGMGRGFRGGQDQARGPGLQRGMAQEQHDDRHDADHDVFHFLLSNHEKIKRTVKNLPNGVETLTESDHEKVADKIKMAHEYTEKGVRVTETSDDPYVATLIQAHAKVVSGFVERGFTEAMKNHAVPTIGEKISPKPTHPIIANHGSVVQLPNAAHQPRPGTKMLVDVTKGSEPAELNSALVKIAKYLNIYAGAGAEPADANIAVVFHGDATHLVLNADAYSGKFKTKGNPNLELLHELHQAGVELYVCGQTLISTGSQPEDVAVFVDTAVSALTAVVNLQADGYAYLPLGK